MTKGLVRYLQTGELHFITFSCYHRKPYLASRVAKELFETALESMRRKYGFAVLGYVVMPEHVHLLVNEPAECPSDPAGRCNSTPAKRARSAGSTDRM
jgi:putative transposase